MSVLSKIDYEKILKEMIPPATANLITRSEEDFRYWVKTGIRITMNLGEFRDLEEQGLLLRVPCKINQDIYFVPSETNFKLNILNNMVEDNRVYHQRICHIVYGGNGYYLECDKELEYGTGRVFIDRHYGEIWFLSKSEAEEKLRELEGK